MTKEELDKIIKQSGDIFYSLLKYMDKIENKNLLSDINVLAYLAGQLENLTKDIKNTYFDWRKETIKLKV